MRTGTLLLAFALLAPLPALGQGHQANPSEGLPRRLGQLHAVPRG